MSDLLFQLTQDERNTVLLIKKKFGDIFKSRMRENAVEDFAPVFLNLLAEMITFSEGDSSKKPEDFRAILRYHFKEEGEKFYSLLIKIFKECFEEFKDVTPALVKIAVNLILIELLQNISPEEIKIEGENIFIKRKRKL